MGRLSTVFVAVALVAVVALVAAPPTDAKEGVVARVLTAIPRDALPGTEVIVAWLSVRDDDGKRHPFNAEAIFVRVLGVRSLVDYAGVQKPLGRYRAVIRVPSGGIRSIRFGLMGWNGSIPAPAFFPIRGRLFR